MFRRILKFAGSLKMAVTLIGGLAAILIVSTILESEFGTPFAQKNFYQTRWFDVFLGAIGLNIMCATLLRLPFQRRHTGFVITHAGLLMLLGGSLVSRIEGIEGQMTLREGERLGELFRQGLELRVHLPGSSPQTIPLDANTYPRVVPLTGGTVTLKQFRHDLLRTIGITEGTVNDPANLALHLTLASPAMETSQSLWLVERDPTGMFSPSVALGPATIRLSNDPPVVAAPPQPPALRVAKKSGGNLASIDLSGDLPMTIPLTDVGLTINDLRYFERATVVDNKLRNADDPNRYFPAVEFTLRDAAGKSERHVKFGLVPDFDSIHGRESIFDVAVELVVPKQPATRGPSLTLFLTPEGLIRYRSAASSGVTEGIAEPGKDVPTSWMDMTFRVDTLYRRAMTTTTIAPAPEGAQGDIGVEIAIDGIDRSIASEWVTGENPLHLHTPAGTVAIVLRPNSHELPFSLALKDFRKIDYPGTGKAASFESDVILRDDKNNVTIERTISMNNPLDYAGYRIFQSSYSQDPVMGESSTFSVASDPGTTIIYVGAIVMFTGVFLLFYIKPLSRTASE